MMVEGGVMTRGGSPLWAIETAEKQGLADEPRSLWDRVESHLRRQEVFTIRRVIGESVLDRNEGLWREVDALEDILKEAQEQNEQLSKKLAARPVMAPGLERTLLEAHLRLLLGKLGVTSGTGPGKGEIAAAIPGSGGVSGGERPRPHTNREHDLGSDNPGSTRSCCAPAESCPKDASPRRKHGQWSPARKNGGSGGNSAPSTPCVPLETRQDRAVYEFISASGDGDSSETTSISGTAAMAAGGSVRDSGSRPETGRRPGSSRSSRSAPECLESGKCISIATIDTALGELQAAFEEEAQNLLEEVADLTNLLEDEAARKADGERRSRQNLPSACDDDVRGHSKSEGISGGGGPIPSSELRRFGKKLEEAVRSREHAAEVAQRLATDKKLPRKRISGISGPVRATGPPVIGSKKNVRRRGREAPTARGGGMEADGGRVHRSGRSPPSMTSDFLQLPSRRDKGGATKTLAARRANRAGSDPVEEGVGNMAAAGTAMVQPKRQSVRRARDRGVLASKLRGAVRLSREGEALDDEKFWN